ncbi:MAG: DNA-binding response regulator [Ignavibacteriales bacterium CG_4_9_14_3_um_filter_34_10]|nr:MAG: DNA-binding response regulator [Ignavibacteriales bacterium CG_4_9_14_3_um_filter_34_10]
MKNKIKTIIVEDEYLARDLLKRYLSNHDDLIVIDECENGFQAVKSINELKPDLIFLDIQLPKINGFEVLELLDYKPQIIFTTAYDEYAVKAFEVNALDYLMKPYSEVRLGKALEKVRKQLIENSVQSESPLNITTNFNYKSEALSRVIVKKNKDIIIIPVTDIIFFEAEDDYVNINSSKGKFLKYKTMKYYEDNLPKDKFIRIHRSYIINISFLKKIESLEKDTHYAILPDGQKIPISKNGFGKLKSFIQ